MPETKQAVIVRFGEPQRIINRYQRGAGLRRLRRRHRRRVPFIDSIDWIDKRILSVDMENQQVLSTDQLRLQVDAFARYRIVDPLRMYISARTEERVSDAAAADPRLGAPQRARPAAVRGAAQPRARPDDGQYPAARSTASPPNMAREIVDVRIKRADLPDGTPLDSAYERMRTARQQEARSIQAQGLKQAQIIRAEADAEAAATYADAFNQDPDFYDFYRAMQSYETSFLAKDGQPAADQHHPVAGQRLSAAVQGQR